LRSPTCYPPVSVRRVVLGVIVGMFMLTIASVALAGTTFIDGEKVDVCQGSTCSPGSDSGGTGTVVNVTTNPSAIATNQTTVTASPRSSASSSARSRSTSRSSSRASATGGNATATGGSATINGPDLGEAVPDVYAPGLATGGDDVCLGSVSGGLGLSGLGAMLGFTLVDDHCQTIKAVKLLTAMGRPAAAVRRACMDDKMRDALGDECPAVKEQPPSSSSIFIP